MANATSNYPLRPVSVPGYRQRVGVAASTHIFKGTLVAQLTADGGLCPGTTPGSGRAIGVAEHEVNNSNGVIGTKECMMETDRVFILDNAPGADAFTAASLIGSPAYMVDDHTAANNDNAGARQIAGVFMGVDAEGVRIHVRVA
ncbi:MAG: hypothetical protein FWD73_06950 [Polyangiaceae bacterium]|nr:hypothetical protein [Polyangiaceae bacterium]